MRHLQIKWLVALSLSLVLSVVNVVRAQNDTLPAPWQKADIGTINVPGVAYEDSTGTMTVANGGGDIGWIVADDFFYVYQPWTGNGEITIRLESMTATHQFAKAGIMFREAITQESKMAYLYRAAGNDYNHLLYRTGTGDSAKVASNFTHQPPYWIKLARYDSTFFAYISSDGQAWSLMAEQNVPMDSVFVGFAVASHDTALICTLQADNITLRTAPEINTDSSLLAYGTTIVNDTAADTLWITSIGSEPLVIQDLGLLSDSSFAVVETIGTFTSGPITVLPGDSLGLVVRFMPVETGDFTDSLRIVSNDPDAGDSVRYVTITGSGEIAVAVHPHLNGLKTPGPDDFFLTTRPATDELCLQFSLSAPSMVHAAIYNQQGTLVQELANSIFVGGPHQLHANTHLPTGIYFVRWTTNASDLVKKVMLVR